MVIDCLTRMIFPYLIWDYFIKPNQIARIHWFSIWIMYMIKPMVFMVEHMMPTMVLMAVS